MRQFRISDKLIEKTREELKIKTKEKGDDQ